MISKKKAKQNIYIHTIDLADLTIKNADKETL